MIVTMTLELSDKPGQLLTVLEPVAEHGGNIVSVTHQRGDVTPRGTLPVEITFEILEDKLDNVVEDIRSHGITLAELGEERYHESVTVVLVGHLVRGDLTDTIDRVEEAGVKIVDFSMSMPEDSSDRSSARLNIKATSDEMVENALDSIQKISQEKDFVVLEPVETGIRKGTDDEKEGSSAGDQLNGDNDRGGDGMNSSNGQGGGDGTNGGNDGDGDSDDMNNREGREDGV